MDGFRASDWEGSKEKGGSYEMGKSEGARQDKNADSF